MKRWQEVHSFAAQVHAANPKIDKSSFAQTIASKYGLTKARSVYFADDFAVRFCYSDKAGFSNTVVSLAAIKKVDDRPFLVCLLRPSGIQTFLANSTLLRQVSHSSQKLTMDRIRGSINGTDIVRKLDEIENLPSNFAALYETHTGFTWEENLARIVETTTAISPKGIRFDPTADERNNIRHAAALSLSAEQTGKIAKLERQLLAQLAANERRIVELAQNDNRNLRGNRIEQLLTGAGNLHLLGDKIEIVDKLRIVVDIKTKLLGLSSSPKLYNIDKALKELSDGVTVFCLFCIGINTDTETVAGRLVDILDTRLIDGTRVQFHWAGRNSRGVTQLSMDTKALLDENFRRTIELKKANGFIERLLSN